MSFDIYTLAENYVKTGSFVCRIFWSILLTPVVISVYGVCIGLLWDLFDWLGRDR